MYLSLWERAFCPFASLLGPGSLGPGLTQHLCLSPTGALHAQVPPLPMASRFPFTLGHLLSGPCRHLSFQALIIEQWWREMGGGCRRQRRLLTQRGVLEGFLEEIPLELTEAQWTFSRAKRVLLEGDKSKKV